MRVFVALPVEGVAADDLKNWADKYRHSVAFRKWTQPQDYHITLQFLGEMDDLRIGELDAALKAVRAGRLALALSGGGIFGVPASPRVLWSAVTGNVEGVHALHQKIVQATQPLGFVPEERPYAPHITVARSYVGGESASGVLDAAKAAMPSDSCWIAKRFVLMRTHMHTTPMYETIGEYPLG